MANFTTPSGAVVDANTGTLVTPPTTNVDTSTPNVTPAPVTPTTPTTSAVPATPTTTATPATASPVTPTTSAAQSAYTGPSIVDYLNSKGQASDFASRSTLASQHGIQGYTGTAVQNTQLLNSMREAQSTPSNSGVTTPTGTPGASGTVGTASTQNTTTGAPDPYAGLDPVQKQVKMYQDSYNALGLNTIKSQYDDFEKQYNDLTQQLSDAIDEKNNNPWLSSTSRSEDIQKIQSRFDVKLKTFANLMTLTDSMYKQGQAQVDHMVSDANADIKATNDLAQKQIDAANAIAKDNVVQSVGGRELLVNKETGKTIADLGPTTPAASTQAGYTLSPGSIRYDANGNVVADNPKPATQPKSSSTAKGSLSSADFVSQTLDTQGMSYQDAISQVPAGRIGVIDNKTGTLGTILPNEYSAAKYTYL